MTTIKITRRDPDPLGYDGDVLARLKAMAKDELAGVGEEAVSKKPPSSGPAWAAYRGNLARCSGSANV